MLNPRHCLSVIIVLVLIAPAIANKNEYLISLPDSLQYNDNKQKFEQLFISIYEQLNIKPGFTYLPTRRAIQMLDSGLVDAEGVRNRKVGEAYKNAIRVPQPITTIDVALICKEQQHCKVSEHSPIGITKGFEAASNYCQQHKFNCTKEKSVSDLMRLLESGLADALLISTNAAGGHICQLSHQQIYYAPIKELSVDMFHYLNPKHKHLLEPLSILFTNKEIQSRLSEIKHLWMNEAKICGKELVEISL